MSSTISSKGHSEPAARKKAAGRKKTTQDGDAVERRRTQLRLAQRAYRERKESTIVELEKKTKDLERALSKMYNVFSEYHNVVSTTRQRENDDNLVQKLAHLRSEFNAAYSATELEMRADHRETDTKERPVAVHVEEVADDIPIEPERLRRNAALDTGLDVRPSHILGYQFDAIRSMDPFVPTSSPQSDMIVQTNTIAPHQPLPSRSLDFQTSNDVLSTSQASTPPPYSQQMPTSPVLNGSPLDVIYASDWLNTTQFDTCTSFRHETQTFARRLYHFCLEQCYIQLADPRTDPTVISYKLQFAYLFQNREGIIDRIRSYLQSLRHTQTAPDPGILPVGGAGCHYARPKIESEFAGRFRLAEGQVRTADEEKLFDQGMIKYASVADEEWLESVLKAQFPRDMPWLDSYDTEVYLRQKGLIFSADFKTAQLEIETEEKVEDSMQEAKICEELNNDALVQQPPDLDWDLNAAHWNLPDVENLPELSWSPKSSDNEDDIPADFDLDGLRSPGEMFSNAMDDVIGTAGITTSGAPQSPGVLRKVKRKVTIDVDKLCTLLEAGALCLGRSPGFRKSVVDEALDIVVREGW